ncbi:MAG: caspase family protein [Bacteroidota bacterium]
MRNALIIGIDEYKSNLLEGNVRNASLMNQVLSRNEDGSPNFNCKNLISLDQNIKSNVIKDSIDKLFKFSHCDVSLLYFSGYGAPSLDGYILSQDEQKISIQEILLLANNSASREVVLILDIQAIDIGESFNSNSQIFTREGITILMGISETIQDSITPLVYEALSGNVSDILGRVKITSIFSYVDNAIGEWSMRPIFKSYVNSLVSIRKCKPKIEISILRKLTYFFKNPDYILMLNPSYEPTAEPKNSEDEKKFALLNEFYSIGIIEPIGENHLYYAAINSKSCQLTALGKYYWQLISRQII